MRVTIKIRGGNTTRTTLNTLSGYGMYKGAKVVGSMLRKRKSKRMSSNSKSKSKSKKSGPWHSDDMNRRYHGNRMTTMMTTRTTMTHNYIS
jgi:hypothetical protein